MSEAWREFEIASTDYLKDNFGSYALFSTVGGEVATASDIYVRTACDKYYIEAKHCPAQSGQFVLFPKNDTKTFEYSSANVMPLNRYSTAIINEMNSHFDYYKRVGTKGVDICFTNCEQVFAGWIKEMYKQKGCRFVITNNFKILPIDDFEKHFNITAKYRVKKSGSRAVGKTRIFKLTQYIKALELNIYDIHSNGGRLFVKSYKNIDKVIFEWNNLDFMFSKREDEFEVRILSNTRNANVIFSLTTKAQKGLSADEFIKML